MSTIRVVNLQHTDATEPNIVLLQDGTSVFASGITISGGTNLTVSGTAEFASGTVSAPGVTFIDDNNTGLYSPAADTVAITTTATERLRIDSSGRVGIGTASPAHNLDISPASGAAELKIAGAEGQEASIRLYADQGDDAADIKKLLTDTSGNFKIQHYVGSAFVDSMVIDSSGNLIVGVEAVPGQIDKQVMLFSAGGGSIAFARQDSEVGAQNNIGELTFWGNDGGSYERCARIAVEADKDHASNDKPSRIVFATTGDNQNYPTERMRIDSSGNLNFTQEAASNYPEQKLKWSNDSTTTNGFYLSQDTTRNGRVWHEQGLDILFGTSNTERMRIDNAGRVLIGRTSSNANADVDNLQIGNNDSATKTGITLGSTDQSGIAFADAGDARAGLIEYTHSIDALRFYTNGATNERLRIDSAGNVGIGILSPQTKLHLSGTTNGAQATFGTSSSGLKISTFQKTGNDAGVILDAQEATNGTLAFSTRGSERMRIDSAGKLLVNTSSARTKYFNTTSYGPLVNFEGTSNSNRIVSFIHNDSSGGPMLVLGATGGSSAGNNDLVNSATTYGFFSFQGSDGTDLVEAARISAEADGTPSANDMPGKLLFYTTADGASSPTARMQIESTGTIRTYMTGSSGRMHLATDQAAGSTILLNCVHSRTDITTGGTASCRIYSDGDIENTNNSYGVLSDERLKENIVDANSQWDDIKSLRIRNFNFKEKTGISTHTQIGVVAQEVELVSPGLVKVRPAATEEGEASEETLKTVNSSVLYMKAVKALQEAMERIETLEQRLSDAGIA